MIFIFSKYPWISQICFDKKLGTINQTISEHYWADLYDMIYLPE